MSAISSHLVRAALAAVILAAGWSTAAQQQRTVRTVRKVTPVEGAQILWRQGEYLRCREVLLFHLYRTASDIKAEALLARCQERLGDRERAAVMYKMCDRSIREAGSEAEGKYADLAAECRCKIALLDPDGPRQQAAYLSSAPQKKFPAPDEVSDLWMTQVQVTKLPLEMLQHPGACVLDALKKGWKFDRRTCTVRKPPDLVVEKHKSPTRLTGPQEFPERHASGAAFVQQAGGRKGILATCPNWAKKVPTQLRIRNVGKCNFLRIGASSAIWSTPTCEVDKSQDRCDFVLNVYVGDKQIFTHVVGGRQWHDLKIDLGEFRGKDVEAVVENASGGTPPHWYESAYFDYIDFFDD